MNVRRAFSAGLAVRFSPLQFLAGSAPVVLEESLRVDACHQVVFQPNCVLLITCDPFFARRLDSASTQREWVCIGSTYW